MTVNEFIAECEAVSVTPALALENEDIAAALRARDDEAVKRLLREEF